MIISARILRSVLETYCHTNPIENPSVNAENTLIKGINTWAVALIRYSGPFLKWTRDELKQMDQRTRKLMTMHKALHPRDDVDRLYISRKEDLPALKTALTHRYNDKKAT